MNDYERIDAANFRVNLSVSKGSTQARETAEAMPWTYNRIQYSNIFLSSEEITDWDEEEHC